MCHSVDQHGTGAALALAAAVLGTRQVKFVPEHPKEWPLRIRFDPGAHTVHHKIHGFILDPGKAVWEMPQLTDSIAASPANEISIVAPASSGPVPPRNIAIDAYRGFVMLLMMAEVLRLAEVSRAFPGNAFWAFLGYNQTHVEWSGCSLHDLIQPSFSLLVGVALPYSLASRMRKGAQFRTLFAHALWRSFLLVALGIFLRSMHSTQTYFTFEDTLTQIGLGYPFLFLLGFCSPRWQWGTFGLILFGYWLAWALYPAPGPNFPVRCRRRSAGLAPQLLRLRFPLE